MGEVGLNNLRLEEVGGNGKWVEEMWLKGWEIYWGGELWYGVRFWRSRGDGVRSGNMGYDKRLGVEWELRGCGMCNGWIVG